MISVSGIRHLPCLCPVRRLVHCGYSTVVPRVRFAPSPTGQLHLGGLRTALYNYLFAKSQNGQFILRVEDTDQARIVPGALEKMVAMLQWAGIQIDEGPLQGGAHGPYVQSQRLSCYHEHLEVLLQNGSAYRCFCTAQRLELLRKEATRRGETPRYDNRCRHMPPKEVEVKLKLNVPYTVRLKLLPFTEPWEDVVYGPITYDVSQNEGDPILLKSDRYPTYHFANVVDDHLMNITHVLRGAEWQVSTPKHFLLYQAFGWTPPKFAHLPLILNKDGSKLSKRQNDIHVEYMKNQGYSPDAVLNLLTSIGSGFKVDSTVGYRLRELVDNFDLSLVKTNSTRLDMDRLPEYNRLHLQRELKVDSRRRELAENVRQLITEELGESLASGELQQQVLGDEYIIHILHWAQDRIHILKDLLEPEYRFLWMIPCASVVQDLPDPGGQGAKNTLKVTIDYIDTLPEQTIQEEFAKDLRNFAHQHGFKYGIYMKLLRISLSGLKEGPPVAEIISILGKQSALQRLKHTLRLLEAS